MKDKYILALDQGTTSTRAILFNHAGQIVNVAQQPFEQIFPKSGWVEHNPKEIWSSQAAVIGEVIAKQGITGKDIAAIGITNQRETAVVWDRETGEPVYNAIVWQDRRTAEYCDKLKAGPHLETFKKKTGLVIDSYFAGTKVKWILDNVEGARKKAEDGRLCFGTIDTWLIYNLTQKKELVTDVTNACRTLFFNIHTCEWDQELLDILTIPKSMMPTVKASSEVYCESATTQFATKIPIAGIAGDQQAALFGQMCIEPGMMKNTYGTGCFLLMNTGEKAVYSNNNLLTTIAWKINGKVTYALEGGVFIGGAAVQWLRDGARIIKTSPDINNLAATVEDNGGVYFVPALAGLGAPHWDSYARGALFGISRGTTDGHIARATLEGIAFQVYDVVKAMEADAGKKSVGLRVDGGASASNLLMQIQANIFGFNVVRPKILETTALGAAYLAGLAVGYWDSVDDIKNQWVVDREFTPTISSDKLKERLHYWNKAVKAVNGWIK